MALCRNSRLEGAFKVTLHKYSLSESSQTSESGEGLRFLPREILNRWGLVLEPKQPHFKELIVMH